MILNRLAHWLRIGSLGRDIRGVSAVEFALIAPIIIMTYLAMAELTLGMMASRRTSHLAATIGDLAAQSETLTDANIQDLWAIGTSMLQPFVAGTNLKIRLTCVTMGTDNVARVVWSEPHNTTDIADGETIAGITTEQISPNESVVMTEVEYNYTSPIGKFLPGDTNFKDTFYHHPRNGTAIVRKSS